MDSEHIFISQPVCYYKFAIINYIINFERIYEFYVYLVLVQSLILTIIVILKTLGSFVLNSGSFEARYYRVLWFRHFAKFRSNSVLVSRRIVKVFSQFRWTLVVTSSS